VKISLKEILETHPKKEVGSQLVPKLSEYLSNECAINIPSPQLEELIVYRYPAAQAVQDQTNVGMDVKVHATDAFHGHELYSTVQVTGADGKWFAQVLLLIEIPLQEPTLKLAFVLQYEGEARTPCPKFKLPLLTKSQTCSVIPVDSIDCVVDLIPLIGLD